MDTRKQCCWHKDVRLTTDSGWRYVLVLYSLAESADFQGSGGLWTSATAGLVLLEQSAVLGCLELINLTV